MQATLLIENVGGMPPYTNVYQLDTPLYGFGHVAVCAFPNDDVNQTFIVGCNSEGVVEAPTMRGIYHSKYVPHADALAACGYQESR